MRRKDQKQRKKSGFTLMETIVTLTLSLLVIAALMNSYSQYRKMMESEKIQTELQSNVRAAMHLLTRTLALTGYGLEIPDSQLSWWITWVSDFDSNPKTSYGSDGKSDSITMAGAFTRPATLASDMSSSDTLVLHSGEEANFDTSTKKLIYIGGLELARVTGVSGSTLTVSKHPSLTAGLHNMYPAGTSIELIEVRRFYIDSDGGPRNGPALMMDNHTADDDYITDINQLLLHDVAAIGIEDMFISVSSDLYSIEIEGVALEPDSTCDEYADNLRRFTMEQHIKMRNL